MQIYAHADPADTLNDKPDARPPHFKKGNNRALVFDITPDSNENVTIHIQRDGDTGPGVTSPSTFCAAKVTTSIRFEADKDEGGLLKLIWEILKGLFKPVLIYHLGTGPDYTATITMSDGTITSYPYTTV
jgi:hypothetical protein